MGMELRKEIIDSAKEVSTFHGILSEKMLNIVDFCNKKDYDHIADLFCTVMAVISIGEKGFIADTDKLLMESVVDYMTAMFEGLK